MRDVHSLLTLSSQRNCHEIATVKLCTKTTVSAEKYAWGLGVVILCKTCLPIAYRFFTGKNANQ